MSTQNQLNNIYRQPETVQLSPDALVFINGSNLLSDSNGDKFDVRQDITEINTSLSIDSVPGTASFTISYPEHKGGKFKTLSSGLSKYSNLKIMSEIEIYFRGRFLKTIDAEKNYPYYRAFWGVVTALTENYNEGMHTITVSCADILRWWQITNTVLNPSIMGSVESISGYLRNIGMEDQDIAKFLKGNIINVGGRYLSITSNIFSGLTIPEIMSQISQVSMLQMVPINDYLSYNYNSVQIDGNLRSSAELSEIMKYWNERLNYIGTRLKIYGLKNFTNSNGRNYLDIDMTQLITLPASQLADAETIRHTLGPATVVYQSFPNAPNIAKSDLKSQLEIANELKEAIHYEFFMDVNGELVFKLPFYNLDVSKNTNSIIHDIDIVNWNFVQSESEVITRVDVSGALADVASDSQIVNGIASDPILALQFGERPVQRSMPWLHSSSQCRFWGRAELIRQNALIRQGSVTIMGRPELKLGYPVFIPSRDAFYYVKGIENRFSFGGTFTTTLTLVAERAQKGIKNSIFRNVGEVNDEQIVMLGDSIAEPNETNNFVKQVSMPSICTPRAKEHVEIVEPSFAVDLSKVQSDKLGTWQVFTNSVAEPGNENEFQLTDIQGYEVIGQVGLPPYISYGYGKTYTATGTIEDSRDTQEVDTAANKSLKMSPQNMQLEIDPNNVMYTLDSTTGKMISYGGKTDAATKAQKMVPEVSE
jgi:hypothetical protein